MILWRSLYGRYPKSTILNFPRLKFGSLKKVNTEPLDVPINFTYDNKNVHFVDFQHIYVKFLAKKKFYENIGFEKNVVFSIQFYFKKFVVKIPSLVEGIYIKHNF